MRATNAQFEAAEILQRLDVRLLELSPGDKGWDVFSLHYHVDGPISTVRKRRRGGGGGSVYCVLEQLKLNYNCLLLDCHYV